MKVGTIVKLKVECLENEIGARGVVYYNYGDGFQVIFENGDYDGFNNKTESDLFLEKIGFCPELAGYRFKNVVQVTQDYHKGVFGIALKRGDYENY